MKTKVAEYLELRERRAQMEMSGAEAPKEASLASSLFRQMTEEERGEAVRRYREDGYRLLDQLRGRLAKEGVVFWPGGRLGGSQKVFMTYLEGGQAHARLLYDRTGMGEGSLLVWDGQEMRLELAEPGTVNYLRDRLDVP